MAVQFDPTDTNKGYALESENSLESLDLSLFYVKDIYAVDPKIYKFRMPIKEDTTVFAQKDDDLFYPFPGNKGKFLILGSKMITTFEVFSTSVDGSVKYITESESKRYHSGHVLNNSLYAI